MRFPSKLLFGCFLCLLSHHSSFAQFKRLRAFIPKGYSILARGAGDINQDDRTDWVVVLRDTAMERWNPDAARPLLLLIGNGKGKYRLLARNDSVVLCLGCGGVHGDPFAGITIKRGYFTIRHFGGSGWRWTRVIAFRYDVHRREFFLHRDGGWSWHISNPAKRTVIVNRKEDFDRLPFEKFSYNIIWEGK